MAERIAIDLTQYWNSFTQLKNVLLRNISLLSIIMFPLTYQVICVEFFVEEQSISACNVTGRCPYYQYTITNGTKTGPVQINPNFELNFDKYGTALMASHFIAMCVGILLLGITADRYGRKNVLFGSLALVFASSLLGAFFAKSIDILVPMRMLAAFGSGGALLTMFVLASEYVHTSPRPLILISLWLASTLSIISFTGLAYTITSRKVLMLSVTLPLLIVVLFYSIIPESPRWLLAQSARTVPNHDIEHNESETLLHKFTSENVSTSRPHDYYGCKCTNSFCGRFIGNKEQCRNLVIVGMAWFAVGMLYRGLNTTTIQLLHNYYANYAVRELVNLLAFCLNVIFVTCAGRRMTTVLSMTLCGIICIVFSFSSYGFFVSAQGAVTVVIQFVGRMLVVLSITSLTLYSIELFPTVVRCSALGLVGCNGFLGAAITPAVMKLQNTNPTIPLAILGSVAVLAAIVLRIFLPETKGALTAETLEDTVVGRQLALGKGWMPRIAMRKKDTVDNAWAERSSGSSRRTHSDPMDIDNDDERFKDLGKSWDTSFDRASKTSKWEWLSYDDAKIRLPSLDIELSFHSESKLLEDSDFEMLRDCVPGTSWILLYSTYDHGISLKTLYHRLNEIETPVLLAIKDHNNYVFGAYSPIPPQVQPGFFGLGKSFFFTCKPEFKLFPNSGKNEYYLHCETECLAFGCSEGTFGLWLDADLYRGRSTACETFNSEVLSSSEDFILLGLEVWTFA